MALLSFGTLNILLFILPPFISGSGLYCYSCGTEGVNDWLNPLPPDQLESVLALESCESFDTAFAWGHFLVLCDEDAVCGKMVTDLGRSVVRGCVPRNDSLGNLHSLGCGSMTARGVPPSDSELTIYDQFCLCESQYCNSSNKIRSKNVLIKIIFWIVLLLYFRQ